jgi:hypothetical protein
MNWLRSLPHQIPFRAASTASLLDEKTIEGSYLCTANDTLPADIMLLEAMAQLAGGLAFRDSARPGFLSGIDECEIERPVRPGDVVKLTVKLDGNFAGTYRFSGTGSVNGLPCIRGRLYLASS